VTKSRDNAIIDLETERDAKRELHKAKEDWKAKYEELRRFVVREPVLLEKLLCLPCLGSKFVYSGPS
jgi:hypothetical protein